MTALVLSPAQVAADAGNKGNFTTADVTIGGFGRTTLVSVTAFLNTDHTHTCIVTASAGTRFDGGGNGRYVFDLTRVNAANQLFTNLSAPTARRMDFVDQAGVNDPNRQPVATNLTFSGLSGPQTFRFTGRKDASTPAAPNITVTESSISVNCQISGGI